jgi:hypothetical protein
MVIFLMVIFFNDSFSQTIIFFIINVHMNVERERNERKCVFFLWREIEK